MASDRAVVICQNPTDKQTLIDFGIIQEKKISLLAGSGVNLSRFRPCTKRSIEKGYVLMAARLLKDKGIEDYCAAAALLRTQYDIEFKLAGVIDKLSPTHLTNDQVEELCLNSGVEFLGSRNDMHQLLSEATAFVYPSYYAEGLPKVLQEAAACGTPVLTSNHPGCRDAVIKNYNGFLFEPKNVSALIETFHQLMRSDIPMLGQNARSLAMQKFDENIIVKAHYDIYRKLLVQDC